MIITTALMEPGRRESTIAAPPIGEEQLLVTKEEVVQLELRHNTAQTEFVPVPVGLPLSEGTQAEHVAAGEQAVVEAGFRSLCLNISLTYLIPARLA